MTIELNSARMRRVFIRGARYVCGGDPSRDHTSYWALSHVARVYVAGIIGIGAMLMVWFLPTTVDDPMMFAALALLSCLTSAWKVTLPQALNSGCTLSVSYAADLMALMLLGPHEAMVVAVAGAWTQCTFQVKRRYPPYRTVFSMASEAITIQATGLVYMLLGGLPAPLSLATLPKALAGAIVTYFVVNSFLVGAAIALSSRQRVWRVWHDNFLWSAPSFVVAGVAGAVAAMVIDRGHHWIALMMAAPVYLTYKTYQVALGRIEDQQRHVEETRQLHAEAVEALLQARRAEQALAAETERLTVTLRSIGDGVITTDLDGTILLINNTAERLTGWTHEEAVGQPFETVFCSFDQTRERCSHSIPRLNRETEKQATTRCSTLAARDLSERPIEEVAATLRDTSGRTIGMVVAFRDISDALKAQEERARAGKLASLGVLAGGIAHDFNNILMAIMGNLSMARVAVPMTGSAAVALAEAEKACVHARQLTWQLLAFSKGGVPAKKTVALPRLLEECAGVALRGSGVSCTFHVDPNLWAVHADPAQLTQVFSNMLINAQQAMPHGGVVTISAVNAIEPRKRCEYALPVEPGPYVSVSITDTGIGIPDENIGSIFDPYFSTKQRGSGLGLATSYSIVKNHGGYVTAESRLGAGTTLSVNLPALVDATAVDAPDWISIPLHGDRGRILVMDDEPAVTTVAVNMLKYLGHDAEVAQNGTDAIERYRHALKEGQPFDAVMLDLVVPGGMGGRETIERLTELDPAVSAIVVSGYTQDSVLTEYRDYGFKAVIAKPFTLQELNTTLHAVMVPRDCRVH
jgi:PAS domain S-box-containing protein